MIDEAAPDVWHGSVPGLDERRRLARELHDVIAHSTGVMVVQAAAARRVLATSPHQALAAIEAIEATGRAALDEMRSLLGSLRIDDGGDAARAKAMAPGLAQLPDLLRTVEAAGLTVTLDADLLEAPPNPRIDLVAYRVVQEALTNAMTHAPGSRVRVTVDHRPDRLTLTVTDDGPAAEPAVRSGGLGLLGMRERVDLVGGQLHAGARPEGGFAVRVELPISRAANPSH